MINRSIHPTRSLTLPQPETDFDQSGHQLLHHSLIKSLNFITVIGEQLFGLLYYKTVKFDVVRRASNNCIVAINPVSLSDYFYLLVAPLLKYKYKKKN